MHNKKDEKEQMQQSFALMLSNIKAELQAFGDSISDPTEEYRFTDMAMYRFDMAWPEYKLAVEFEGGIFIKGRHTRGLGYNDDCIKYSIAAIMGWRVIRTTTVTWKNGMAEALIRYALWGNQADLENLKRLRKDDLSVRRERQKRRTEKKKEVDYTRADDTESSLKRYINSKHYF